MLGIVTKKEEWLYPDSMLSELPEEIEIHTAINGKRGIQLLIESGSEEVLIHFEKQGCIDIELYEMIDIPVESNTESSTAQGGFFTVSDRSLPKPEHCTRKAPFRVYDCLKPAIDTISVKNERAAAYLCFSPRSGIKVGEHAVTVSVGAVDAWAYRFTVILKVFNVSIPMETFNVTNWFSLDAMAEFHHIPDMSKVHLDMVRKYASLMRRTRQTHFFMEISPDKCIKNSETLEFDFTFYKKIAEIFFSEGFKAMELGYFATKGGDNFTEEFKCSMDKTVPVASDEGYFITLKLIKALADFLKDNGWQDKVIFHICDEPDEHLINAEVLEKRKKQYFRVASMLRKYIPYSCIIEAVKSTEFKGGVDIWTPLTMNYEENKEQFERLREEGDEVWTYVCCGPVGNYLNRFMDIDLIKPRLLFWGCSKYRLSGYLHWGFNMYVNGLNPFIMSCCPNDSGYGTSFPPGDAHLVYPGEGKPWISMRLEAQRRGIEDYELLELLRKKDSILYQKLIDKMFKGFQEYNSDVNDFDAVYMELLENL